MQRIPMLYSLAKLSNKVNMATLQTNPLAVGPVRFQGGIYELYSPASLARLRKVTTFDTFDSSTEFTVVVGERFDEPLMMSGRDARTAFRYGG